MMIIYYPELVKVTGSINATILMSKLEYWFKVKEGKPFYKFLTACGHEACKAGDSWTEELGMSKSEVRNAFKLIGTAHKSKTAFDESSDPFQGKLYASYYDRMKKITYYFRNHEEVAKLGLETDVKSDFNSVKRSSQDVDKTKSETSRRRETESRLYNKDYNNHFNKDSIKESDRCTSESKEYKLDDQEENTLEPKKETLELKTDIKKEYQEYNKADYEAAEQSAGSKRRLEKTEKIDRDLICESVCSLYNDFLGEELGVKSELSLREKESLMKLNQEREDKGLVEDLKKAFKKTAGSSFLCGKTSHSSWKACLLWLLNEENLEKVLSGKYDGVEKKDGAVSGKVREYLEMDSRSWDFDEIERMERRRIDQYIAQMNQDEPR